MAKFKAKDKDKPKENKRIVTKPLPLMYKSSKRVLGNVTTRGMSNHPKQSVDENKNIRRNKSQSEESLLNLEIPDQRPKKKPQKTRSADNSPRRNLVKPKTKKGKSEPVSEVEDVLKNNNKYNKSLPLRQYIKKSKPSTNDKDDEFTIDFFEKPVRPPVPESPFHNPHSNYNNSVGLIHSNPSSRQGTPNTFGGVNTPNLTANQRHSYVSNKGHRNILRRPNQLDERPVEEPSDDEELESIDLGSKLLGNVPEGAAVKHTTQG